MNIVYHVNVGFVNRCVDNYIFMDFYKIVTMSVIVAILGLVVYFVNKKFAKIDKRYQERLSQMTTEEIEKEKNKAKKETNRKKYTIVLPVFVFVVLTIYQVEFILSGLISVVVYLLSKIIWKKYFENRAIGE